MLQAVAQTHLLEQIGDGPTQVLVAMGDAPLVPAAVFAELLHAQAGGDAAIALLASRPSDPSGYGRIVRNVDGSLAISAHGVRAGPVLLVDDIVDSRWTLTVAAWLLRCHGSGEVLPLALALAGYDE